jgi:hypothetical protein
MALPSLFNRCYTMANNYHKTMTEFETIQRGIEQIARKEILRDFRIDSCIASTRTVMRVLEHFGFDAQPLSVRVFIFNAAYVKHLNEKTARFNGDPTFRRWLEDSGAYSVGLGCAEPGQDNGNYVGHLVAAVPQCHLFIDASLDQAARPQKNILLPEVLISPMTQQFMTTVGENLEFESSGATMIYERIDNPAFRTSPDWTDKSRTKRATKAIIRHIERFSEVR